MNQEFLLGMLVSYHAFTRHDKIDGTYHISLRIQKPIYEK